MRQVRGKKASSRPAKADGRAPGTALARLRGHARTLGRLLATRPQPRPRGLARQVIAGNVAMWPALSACAAFFCATTVYGAVLGGHLDGSFTGAARIVHAMASIPGFSIRQVQIEGSVLGREDAILDALGAKAGDPILWLDTHKAKLRVEALPTVRSASVLRLLPGDIKVEVEERIPFAIWQSEGALRVIDADGVVISERLDRPGYAHLPLVVGAGANSGARDFLDMLADFPDLRARMRAAVRVGDRRWNIRLLNDVDIRLPGEDVRAALEEVARLEAEHGLFTRDIAAIDLRLADRVTIRLSDEAAERRDVRFKTRQRLAGKGGRT